MVPTLHSSIYAHPTIHSFISVSVILPICLPFCLVRLCVYFSINLRSVCFSHRLFLGLLYYLTQTIWQQKCVCVYVCLILFKLGLTWIPDVPAQLHESL